MRTASNSYLRGSPYIEKVKSPEYVISFPGLLARIRQESRGNEDAGYTRLVRISVRGNLFLGLLKRSKSNLGSGYFFYFRNISSVAFLVERRKVIRS